MNESEAVTKGIRVHVTSHYSAEHSQPQNLWFFLYTIKISNESTDTVQLISRHWIITNVPYLARGKQSETLRDFCATHYKEAKNDLATVFLDRCLELCVGEGTAGIVLPQNWLFLTSYITTVYVHVNFSMTLSVSD